MSTSRTPLLTATSALRAVAVVVLAACSPAPASSPATRTSAQAEETEAPRLPTGVRLDPAGPRSDVGNFPLAAVLAPDSAHILLLLNGWREQGVQVVERRSGRVVQTVPQTAAFIGLAFSPDGRTLYASGGNTDAVYRYDWRNDRLALRDSIILRAKEKRSESGTSYPAGIAASADGRQLFVTENLADSLAVVDVASGNVVQRLAAGRYPYAVAVAPDGSVYTSSWGTQQVHHFRTGNDGRLQPATRIDVARHPSTLLINRAGNRLFVVSASTDAITVIDTRTDRVVSTLRDPTPANLGQGSTPIALALAPDQRRLYVTEGDNNAVALFALSANTSGIDAAAGGGAGVGAGGGAGSGAGSGAAPRDTLLGRAPVGWFPASLLMVGDTLHVIDAKGRGTGPNPGLPQPGQRDPTNRKATNYTYGQINGTITRLPVSLFDQPSLDALSARVARANNWNAPAVRSGMPPIDHVIYVIKENRTYDQMLGDLTQADGDTSLVFFPRSNSPNHHALAERFGIYERFFVNAEVSADGHNWSMAAYTTDYTEKTVPSNYSSRGRTYDYEGSNRGRIPMDDGDDDAAEPANGYLWDLAKRKGITFRNFGEFVRRAPGAGSAPPSYRGIKPFLAANTSPEFPPFNLDIPDQTRADIWIRELAGYTAKRAMPALQIVRLPNDHTSGAAAGKPTPQAAVADNDLALGRMVEALSKSPFWGSTAMVVLEDDAQNGPDHVDSHRSVLIVISPWARTGVHHRFVNTTDAIATIEALLGLDALSPYDHYGRPLRDVWRTTPDLRPYTPLVPAVALTDLNPAGGGGAEASRHLDLRYEDEADDEEFNHILWRTIKGPARPYPGATRMSFAEIIRSW